MDQLFLWFKTQELITLQRGKRSKQFETVCNALTGFLPGAEQIYWDIEQDALTLIINGESTPFGVLSDGYKTMLAMAADIAFRAATLNPHLGDQILERTEGVVLIDELDLHLHPKWQQDIVANLMNVFPGIQFVATTHSPFILQSIQKVSGTRLVNLDDRDGTTSGGAETEFLSLEEVAEEKQGVANTSRSRRYQEMIAAAEEYYSLLNSAGEADPGTLETLKRRLDELIAPYGDNPAYQAFLAMKREASGIDRRDP